MARSQNRLKEGHAVGRLNQRLHVGGLELLFQEPIAHFTWIVIVGRENRVFLRYTWCVLRQGHVRDRLWHAQRAKRQHDTDQDSTKKPTNSVHNKSITEERQSPQISRKGRTANF